MMVVGSYDVMEDDHIRRAAGMAALDKACTGGEHEDRGWVALGDGYRGGVVGVARDRNRARSFYSTACRAGSEVDCSKLKCFDSDSDSCYKVKRAQRERRFRLGGAFDMK